MKCPASSTYRTSPFSSTLSIRRFVSAESSIASFAPTIANTGIVSFFSAASLKTGRLSVRGFVLL